MIQRDWRKLALITFKYSPVITALIMLIHVACMMLGKVFGIAESLCGLSLIPLCVTYCLSKGLGFCKMHRMFIDYTFKMYLCMQWELWIGFGNYLIYFQWYMLITGFLMFIYFFYNFDKFYYHRVVQIEKAPTH